MTENKVSKCICGHDKNRHRDGIDICWTLSCRCIKYQPCEVVEEKDPDEGLELRPEVVQKLKDSKSSGNFIPGEQMLKELDVRFSSPSPLPDSDRLLMDEELSDIDNLPCPGIEHPEYKGKPCVCAECRHEEYFCVDHASGGGCYVCTGPEDGPCELTDEEEMSADKLYGG